MKSEEEDFEEAWSAIRVRGVDIVAPQAEGPEAVIDRAMSVVKGKVRTLFMSRTPNDEFFTERLPELLSTFAKALFAEQKKQDSSVLIHLFLDTTDAPLDEVKDFVRALPVTLIRKILARLPEGDLPKTGLHALLSIELLWRERSLARDYEIQRTGDGTLQMTFYPAKLDGAPVNFILRELF